MNKIFVVAPGVFFNGTTGDSIHLTSLWNAISKIKGCEIDIFSASKKQISSNLKINKTFFKRSKYPLLTGIFLLNSILLVTIKLFIKYFLKKPNIIYSRHQIINPFLFLPINTKKTNLVLEVNGFFAKEVESQGLSFLKPISNIIKIIEKLSFKKSHKILVVSELMKEVLVKKYEIDQKKVSVITNGVDINIFSPIPINAADLSLPSNKQYVCFVGNLIPWQGIELILEAAGEIIQKYNKIHFLIVGDGILRKKLEIITSSLSISQNIHFIGRVNHEDVAKFINLSKICLAPFVTERNNEVGFSAIKVFEYLACGKPVIATNLPGNNLEIINTNNFGVLIKPDDYRLLANTIISMINNNEIIENTHKKSYTYVKEYYSWDKIAKNIYDEFISQ